MTVKGLPPLDEPPFHMQDKPHSCRDCTHSFYQSSDHALRYLRCGRAEYSQQCRYERHETGTCGPAALHFKARSI